MMPWRWRVSTGPYRALLASIEMQIDTDRRESAQSALAVLLADFPTDGRVIALAQRLEALSAPVMSEDQLASTADPEPQPPLGSDTVSRDLSQATQPDAIDAQSGPAVSASERAAAVRAAETERLVVLVRERIAASDYLEPSDDSASHYLSMLGDLDPNAEQISVLRGELLASAVAEIESALSDNNLEAAGQRITAARDLGVEDETLNPLAQRLAARRTQAVMAERQAVLDGAIDAIQAGSLIAARRRERAGSVSGARIPTGEFSGTGRSENRTRGSLARRGQRVPGRCRLGSGRTISGGCPRRGSGGGPGKRCLRRAGVWSTAGGALGEC